MDIFMVFFLFFLSFFTIVLSDSQDNCTDFLIDQFLWPPPYNYYLNTTENFTVIDMDNSSDARCSDGSIYKIYYLPGHGSGSNKFMFFFPGGGFCGDDNTDMLDNCVARMTTFGGSSNTTGANGSIYAENLSLGYFSSRENINPLFWNWNKIWMPYCDGTLFQGYQKDPILHNGTEIWFRGYNNTKAVLEYARKKFGLFEAEEVIVTGISAGGQAVFLWMNYIRKYLPQNVKLSGLIDAGLFLDVMNQNSKCYLFRHHMEVIANYTGSMYLDLFENCTHNKSEFYKCLIPEYFVEDIDVPMFIVNSQNDWQILRGAYGLHCLDHGIQNCGDDVNDKITGFRESFLRVALKLKQKKKTWGFWLRRCVEHYYGHSIAWSENMTAYSAESYVEKNIRSAYYEWYINRENAPDYIDLENFQIDCQLINDSQ